MFTRYIIWIKLLLSLFCYITLGWLFAWTPGWAEALQSDEALQQDSTFTLSRITLIILTLTLTRSFAWKKFGIMSWTKILGWCYILSHVVSGILLLVFGGGITLHIVWLVVVSVAWVGAFTSVAARNQLLLSFSQVHTVVILRLISILGLGLGALGRLSNP